MAKRKGKVYPSLSSPPSPSSSSSCKDPESILKLLPVTILALASSLPTHDRQVLAYLIARSLVLPPSTNHLHKKCKRAISKSNVKNDACLGCGCFDCYTSFWYRWDSSPNREVIHRVIEEFEEHLVINETLLKKKKKKKKKKKRGMEVVGQLHHKEVDDVVISSCLLAQVEDKGEDDDDVAKSRNLQVIGCCLDQVSKVRSQQHKCLGRKVLSDVVGLISSRLWNLWSPTTI